MSANVDRYWDQYLDSLPTHAARSARYADSFYFGTVPNTPRRYRDLNGTVLKRANTACERPTGRTTTAWQP